MRDSSVVVEAPINLRRFNHVLLTVGLVLSAVLALVLSRGGEALPTEAEQLGQRHLDVTRAAAAQVQAFLGIDHQNVDERAQVVLDGGTGDFKQQYADELDSLARSAQAQRSTAEATVLEVGMNDIDASTATVFVAADTEVTSKVTDGKARTVPWRIQLDMVKEGERWLTSGLQFVG